jgi:hypothetical protein
MLLKGTEVLENIDEGNLTRELEIAKFRNYGREKFSDLIQNNINFDYFMRNSSQFYSINLPKEISDYFLRADIAPFFIMSEAPILKRIEELLLANNNEFNFVSNYREIKKNYYKWLIEKNEREKHFLSNSIINSIERNFPYQSFYNVLIYGIVLGYDSNVYNPQKAIELFIRAEELVGKCNLPSNINNEILYFINLYKGFVHLKEYEYKHSLKTFKNALKYNANGITAIFYCGLSARYIDDFDTSFDYLREIIEFDKTRFKYAIDFNHLTLFSFFYKNAIFYHVFTENGFAQLLPDIDFLIRSHFSGEVNSMDETYGKLINLDNLRIKDFFDDRVFIEIKFLKDVLDQYKQKRNGLVRIVEQIFREKLITLIEYIRSLIESHYFDQIKEEIIVFDKQIEQNKRQLIRINHEMEDSSKKIKTNLDEAAEFLIESITEQSKLLEQKINNLDENPKYNPSQVFYNSIVFTIFVAFIIILVVGVITSIVGYGEEIASTQVALKTSLKWGGVTFAVGVFISVFTTVSSYWEKSSEKKELITKLNKVKETEAQERDLLNEDSERKEVIYNQKFKTRIKAQEKIIENFVKERDQNYNHKYSLAKKEIDQYTSPINNILKSL